MSTLEGEKTMQEAQPEIKTPTVYEVADFHLKCHGCGEDIVAIPNVKGGLRTDLFTTDAHNFIMECSKCGAKLEYYFTEAANPPEAEEEEPVMDDKEISPLDNATKEDIQVPTTPEEVAEVVERFEEAVKEDDHSVEGNGVQDGPVEEPKK